MSWVQTQRQFELIFDRFMELGLPLDSLTSLESFTSLQDLCRSTSVTKSNRDSASVSVPTGRHKTVSRCNLQRSTIPFLVALLIMAACVVLELNNIVTMWLMMMMTGSDRCLLSTDSSIANLFRPPVNCTALCHDVIDLERFNFSQRVDPGILFESRYAYSGRPVVISGATANWPATKTFSFDYFRSLYANSSEERLSSEDCQFFPWGASEFENLYDVFQMDRDRATMKNGTKPWYFGWSNCDSTVTNVLRSQYDRPAFLPETSESSRIDWIFMGSPGFGAPMHVDDVRKPSWQAQVTGSKRWIIEPPPECYLECVQRMETTVNKGDIIVLDTNQWYHSTQVVGSAISITIGSEYD